MHRKLIHTASRSRWGISRSVLVLAALAVTRLLGTAGGLTDGERAYAESGSDYDTGWWAGYDDGYAGNPQADTSNQSADYQSGYTDGYATGEMDADPAGGESEPSDYDTGWWAGYDDGYEGLPAADTSSQSTDYQTGYSDGYGTGLADGNPV